MDVNRVYGMAEPSLETAPEITVYKGK